jgi:hypothetical protein
VSLTAAIQDFCDRVYEQTCAQPSRIVLPPAAFDTLATEVGPLMRRFDDGKEDETGRMVPVLVMETGLGSVVIERGRA